MSYVPPKKNTAYICYISLVSQADTKLTQVNPTLAAGDFQVSIDGGALNNLATLPTVTPAAGRMVKISLSAAEMNGDNITVVCSDAAGAEWCDLTVNIQTSAAQIDDLVRSTTPANTLDVSATGEAGVDWANVGTPGSTVALSATTVATVTTTATATNLTNAPTSGDLTATMKTSVTTACTASTPTAAAVTGAVGSVTGAVGSVTGAVGSVTGNVGGNVVGSVASVTGAVGSVTGLTAANLDATVSSRATPAQVNAEADTAIADAALATAAALATVDGVVDAILLDTAEIGAAGAGLTALGDVRIANLDAAVSSRATPAQVNAEADTAIADAALATAAALATVDGVVDAILLDTAEIGAAGAGLTALGDVRIANLDATVSSRLATTGYTAAPSAAANASAVAAIDIGGRSLQNALRNGAAVQFGTSAGLVGGFGTVTFTDGANVVVGTIDADGNRTSVTPT